MNIENLSKVQKKLQRELKKTNRKNNYISGATGIGKSKIGIDYIKENKASNVLIVVPRTELRDKTWIDEIEKWKLPKSINVDIVCYVSLNKIKNSHYDVIILDEVHNITEYNSEFFTSNNNTYNKLLGLSATLPYKDNNKMFILKHIIGMDYIYELSLDDAVLLGIVCDYTIYVHYVDLDTNKNISIPTKKGSIFYTSEIDYYKYWNGIAEFRRDKRSFFKRKRILSDMKSKIDYTKKLIQENDEKRILVFSGSIPTAEKISSNTYHSKTDRASLESFENFENDLLVSVDSLDEGVNLPYIDSIIINQISKSSRKLIQRIGRTIRYRENHKAEVHIVLSKNTKDEEWFNEASIDLDKTKIVKINA